MNKARRKEIKKATEDFKNKLEELLIAYREQIEDIQSEEQEALDNMPESLQDTERYEAMDNAVSAMDDVIGNCEVDCLDYIMSSIDDMYETCEIEEN